jgi:hypothetical protein
MHIRTCHFFFFFFSAFASITQSTLITLLLFCLIRHAVEDSVGFGSILIKALSNHGDLVKQVRATFASTHPAHHPPFNVAYAAKVVPLLYVDAGQEDDDKDHKKQRRQEHRGHPYQGHKGNNGGKGSGKGNYGSGSGNNGSNGSNGNKRFKKGSGPHTFKMATNNCRHCNQPWRHGHHCKEFFDDKRRQAENNDLRARMATMEERLATQDVELAMRKIDLNECTVSCKIEWQR